MVGGMLMEIGGGSGGSFGQYSAMIYPGLLLFV